MPLEYRDPDTGDMFGENSAPTVLDVSHGANVSQASNGEASEPDTARTQDAPPCPIAHEVDPGKAEPEEAKAPRRPAFATHLARSQFGQPGLYFHGQRQPRGDGDPEPFDTWV